MLASGLSTVSNAQSAGELWNVDAGDFASPDAACADWANRNGVAYGGASFWSAWAYKCNSPNGGQIATAGRWPRCASGYTFQPDGACVVSRPPVQACAISHPVIPGTGTKIVTESDGGSTDLPVTRSYRSFSVFGSSGGAGQWLFNWQRRLDTSLLPYVQAEISALRNDGSILVFQKTGTRWGATGTQDTLQPLTDANGKVTGWQYGGTNTGAVESYDASGRLLSVRERNGRTTTLTYNAKAQLTQVTAPSGRSLTLAYDTQNRVSSITAPDGAVTKYSYNATSMLSSVTWPDNTVRQYVYEDSRFPTALTGVIDEAGVRYATYAYDDQGRAITSELTGGTDRYQFQYQANNQTIVTQPSGTTSTYNFLKQNGVLLPTGVSAPCPTCGSTAQSTSYDANNNPTSKTGYDGSTTAYSYDALGRETQRVVGAGTADAKTTTTEWDAQ
nr:hypothetical protein [Ralstonia sp. A12]